MDRRRLINMEKQVIAETAVMDKELVEAIQAEANMEELSQPQTKPFTRTDYFNMQTKEYKNDVQQEQGLTGRFARQLVRRTIAGVVGYKVGELGASQFAKMASRKDRRQLAKLNKVPFVPVYNGNEPVYVNRTITE